MVRGYGDNGDNLQKKKKNKKTSWKDEFSTAPSPNRMYKCEIVVCRGFVRDFRVYGTVRVVKRKKKY